MKIAIGSDHAGFSLKQELVAPLTSAGHEVLDLGTSSPDSVDYPDFAGAVARSVFSGEADRGILVCGSGIGMSIAANRFPGIRAALCLDVETARLSRAHNDSNVLVLAGRKTGGAEARSIVEAWLSAEFEGGRHAKRLQKLEALGQTFGP